METGLIGTTTIRSAAKLWKTLYLKGEPGKVSEFMKNSDLFGKYLESLEEISEAYFSATEKEEEEADPYEEILMAVKQFEHAGKTDEEDSDELPF